MSFNRTTPILDLVVNYEVAKREGEPTTLDQDQYNKIIDYFEWEEMYKEALSVVNEAMKEYPHVVRFLFKKIHLQIFSGELDNALTNLDVAAGILDDSFDIELHRAYVFSELGIYDKATNILNKLEDSFENDKDQSLVLYYRALVEERIGDYDTALKNLVEAIQLDPTNDEALEKFYGAFSRKGDQGNNIKLFKKVINEEPYSWWGWFNLGVAYQHDCEYESALNAYEFAIAIDDNDLMAYQACGELYMMVRNYEKALRCFNALFPSNSMDTQLMLDMAECYLELEKVPTARKFLTMANEQGEEGEEIFFKFAECCKKEGRLKYAIRHYKEALKMNPFRDDVCRGLAEAYIFDGKYTKAKKMYRLATEVAPDFLYNWETLAEFLYGIGQQSEALEAVVEAQYYFDSSIKLKYYEVAYKAALGKTSEAKYYLLEALEEDFASRYFLFDAHPEFIRIEELMQVIEDFDKNRLSNT